MGIFAARISRGRTIRAFVGTMLLVPTLAGFFWFSAVGGTSLFLEHFGTGGIAEAILGEESAEEGSALAVYALLAQLPWSAFVSALVTVLIVVFFVTSSDSGSLVDVMVTSGGKENPSTSYRVFWAVAEGAVAAVLLVAGGLTALRTASLTPALPMVIFLLIACVGLVKALRVDIRGAGAPATEALHKGRASVPRRK